MNFRHQLWMFLGRSQLFFDVFKLIQIQNKGIKVVNKNCDIVIDGYPRSANTFAYVAFKVMQNSITIDVSIAHHVHGPMQFINGLKRNIPCLLLIRSPLDAVVSLLIREQNVNPSLAFKNYIKFHEPLIPYIDRLVISDFEFTINRFSDVVYTLNKKLKTNFNVNPITDSFMEECKQKIREMDKEDSGNGNVDSKKVGLPSKEKEKLKDRIRKRVELEVDKNLINECEHVYKSFKENSLS